MRYWIFFSEECGFSEECSLVRSEECSLVRSEECGLARSELVKKQWRGIGEMKSVVQEKSEEFALRIINPNRPLGLAWILIF